MQLEKLLSMVFCCSVKKCKMKLLNGGTRELMLSNTTSVCLLYQGAILFEDETSKLCCIAHGRACSVHLWEVIV